MSLPFYLSTAFESETDFHVTVLIYCNVETATISVKLCHHGFFQQFFTAYILQGHGKQALNNSVNNTIIN